MPDGLKFVNLFLSSPSYYSESPNSSESSVWQGIRPFEKKQLTLVKRGSNNDGIGRGGGLHFQSGLALPIYQYFEKSPRGDTYVMSALGGEEGSAKADKIR